MSPKTKIIFRADGNSIIGLGHVVRSLALAEMLKRDFDCIFAIQAPSEAVCREIMQTCNAIISLPDCHPDTEAFSGELLPHLSGNEIVVLDGYRFNPVYQQKVRAQGCSLVYIDDLAETQFVVDVIINQAGGFKPENYQAEAYTNFCLGPAFALLRPPFLKQTATDFPEKNNRKLFLNMGGADPENETCAIIEKLKNLAQLSEIHVVTGSAYKHLAALHKTVSGNEKIWLYNNLNASEMANLMRNCDIAVCPPSSVSYEYASQGGLLFVKQTAENQDGIKAYLLQQRLAFDFESNFFAVLDTDIDAGTKEMKQRQRQIFDGESPARLRQVFLKLDLPKVLSLRQVTEADMLVSFRWANDPETRASSFNTAPIKLEDHKRWFAAKIKDQDTAFYIAAYYDRPVGQIRFDGENQEKLISYLVAPEMRGLGLGNLILQNGIEKLLQENPGIAKISGYVKNSNLASCRIFEKAGFSTVDSAEMPYPDAVKYEFVVNR